MQPRTGPASPANSNGVVPRTHVYAIIQGKDGLPPNWQTGFQASLRHISFKEVAAIVGDCVPSKSAAMTRTVLRHRQVVERLFHYFPIVPLRTGILFANDWEVGIFLATHHKTLQWNLDRLAGRAEFRLRANWFGERIRQQVEQESSAIGRIRSEKRAKQPEESRFVSQLESLIMTNKMREIASQLSLKIHTLLLAIASEGAIEVVADSRQMMMGTYLVDRHQAEDFRSAIRAFEAEHTDLRLSVSGPLPPYSFTDVGLGSLQASD